MYTCTRFTRAQELPPCCHLRPHELHPAQTRDCTRQSPPRPKTAQDSPRPNRPYWARPISGSHTDLHIPYTTHLLTIPNVQDVPGLDGPIGRALFQGPTQNFTYSNQHPACTLHKIQSGNPCTPAHLNTYGKTYVNFNRSATPTSSPIHHMQIYYVTIIRLSS